MNGMGFTEERHGVFYERRMLAAAAWRWMYRVLAVSAAWMMLILVFATLAQAAPAGGEFQVNTTTSDSQESQSVAMDSDGDFVVTWDSSEQDGSSWGIYGQRYNAAGVAQGAEFQVNTYTTGYQFNSSVAMDSDGDFVVTWVGDGQDGSDYGIYGQRYDENVDTTAPTVSSVTPTKKTGVSRLTNITATFSEKMDEASVETAGVVTLRKGTGAPLAAAVTYDPATKKAVLNPNANLKRGAKYKAVVATGAEDLAGNGIDQNPTLTGAQPKQWSFTVKN